MKEYKFKINGKEYKVAVNGIEGNIADVTVNGNSYSVEVEEGCVSAASVSTPSVSLSGGRNESASGPQAASAPISANAVGHAGAPASSSAGTTISSPLPGDVIEVSVKEGQAVKKGQKVAVIEAMKMENDILSECDGTVTSVYVTKGDHVDDGAKIVTIS